MGQSKKVGECQSWAVYCGNGVYVSAVDHGPRKIKLKTGGIDEAMVSTREFAIAALHVARRAGLGAWLVQHQAAAL